MTDEERASAEAARLTLEYKSIMRSLAFQLHERQDRDLASLFDEEYPDRREPLLSALWQTLKAVW